MKVKRFFLASVVILALIGCAVNSSYAHPVAVISGCATGKEVCVDSSISFSGSNSYDTDEGGDSIVDYQWSWPTEAYDESGQGTDTFSCKFTPAGTYTVSLRVKDDEGVWSTWKHCTVYVVEVTNVSADKTTVDLGCDDDITFTVTTNPPGHCGPVTWNGGGPWSSTSPDNCQFTTHWDDPGAYTVTASCGSSSDSKEVYVIGVSTLEWETFSEFNTPLDNNKIFPGKKHPDDPWWDIRRTVWVKVTVVPAPQAAYRPLYFSRWDPDDPCSDPDIDTNGDSGGDNFDDGTGIDKAGKILAAPADAGPSGVTWATFQVSRQPGNNFTMAASTCQARLDELTQAKLDSGDIPRGVELSPILTTWRKLWIEQDSMEQVATSGSQMNHVEGTASGYEPYSPTSNWVKLGQNLDPPWNETDQFHYGHYVVSGFTPYDVVESTAYWFAEDKARVRGDPQGDGVPIPTPYKIYDDDDTTLDAYPSMGDWAAKYKAAYIKIEYLSTSYQDEVSFLRHLSTSAVGSGSGDWDDDHDVFPDSHFWISFVCTAFQPQREKDGDPDSESPRTLGATRFSGPGAGENEGVIYLETIRDVANVEVGHTMAHELGHTGGADDQPSQEGCIMYTSPSSGIPGDNFCGECLRELREDAVY